MVISIHAPRRGSDGWVEQKRKYWENFNPRSPQGERQDNHAFWYLCRISIHAPRRGSDVLNKLIKPPTRISIHAPRRGSDERPKVIFIRSGQFQSTLPAGGATSAVTADDTVSVISIHAPRRGSDQNHFSTQRAQKYFNPRSPQGERQFCFGVLRPYPDFNPRSPQGERPLSDKLL